MAKHKSFSLQWIVPECWSSCHCWLWPPWWWVRLTWFPWPAPSSTSPVPLFFMIKCWKLKYNQIQVSGVNDHDTLCDAICDAVCDALCDPLCDALCDALYIFDRNLPHISTERLIHYVLHSFSLLSVTWACWKVSLSWFYCSIFEVFVNDSDFWSLAWHRFLDSANVWSAHLNFVYNPNHFNETFCGL